MMCQRNGNDECVAVRDIGHGLEPIEIADTKRPNALPLAFTRSEWRSFVEDVIAGRFDELTDEWTVAGDPQDDTPSIPIERTLTSV